MNVKLTTMVNEAASLSNGLVTITSFSDSSIILGTEVGETMDLFVAGKPAKLLLLELTGYADIEICLPIISRFEQLLMRLTSVGIQAKILLWSRKFASDTMNTLALRGVASAELTTGAMRLILDGYAFVNAGDHRMYPQAGSFYNLLTLRGKDMLKILMDHPLGTRFTTQSLAAEASTSTSAVHRFVSKLRDLDLIAKSGSTGFCLTSGGRNQIVEAIPEMISLGS